MRVLVTGAGGFVGRNLCRWLVDHGHVVRAVRRPGSAGNGTVPANLESVEVPDLRTLDSPEAWGPALAGMEGIVHLAGLAHAMGRNRPAAKDYEAVNEAGTQSLARSAVRSGISRLVFVSTIKVHGEETSPGRPFSESDTPNPLDDYAVSKQRAEQALLEETRGSTCSPVIVRPPLVYGPGVRGNFPRLVRLVQSGLPLPLGAVRNRRSVVSVWNLCDLLECALRHPAAAGRLLLPADDRPVSTPELLRLMAATLGTRARLVPVPVSLLAAAAGLLGARAELARLTGSLEVDNAVTRQALQWQPPLTIEQGLARTLAPSP